MLWVWGLLADMINRMKENSITRFYRELKRRKVVRVAIVYVVVAWIMVEVASVMFPALLLPEWSVRLVIAFAIIGFPIALVLSWAFQITPDGIKADSLSETQSPPAEEAAGQRDDHRSSVAVLPFINLSNDPDNEYFSDGMAEEVLNLLCKLPQLTVASRTSAFSFKGKDVDMATVAEALGVDAILEGSVRRSGNRVRITAQLIDGRSDRHLWSENYDRELEDVFAVQDEIARNIVDAMEISLTPAQQHSIQTQATTTDMNAYDFYLRGRYFFERKEVAYAQQMYEKSIEQDPEFAQAWAALSECHTWTYLWFEKTPESLRAAYECSNKALQLAPDLAEAHAALGQALSMDGDYVEAEKEFKAAIDLDPQLYDGYYNAGRAYFTEGKFRAAADMFAKAGFIRPDDATAATLQCMALLTIGTEEEKQEAVERSVRIAEQYLVLNPDDALALSRAATDLLHTGDIEKGVAWAERAYAINPRVSGYNVACAFILAGQTERALDILDEHTKSAAVHIDWLEKDSDWDATRDHPRFKAIVESLRE